MPNRATVEIKAFARRLLEDGEYRKHLRRALHDGTIAPPTETLLFHYAYGGPKDEVELIVRPDVSKLSDEELWALGVAMFSTKPKA